MGRLVINRSIFGPWTSKHLYTSQSNQVYLHAYAMSTTSEPDIRAARSGLDIYTSALTCPLTCSVPPKTAVRCAALSSLESNTRARGTRSLHLRLKLSTVAGSARTARRNSIASNMTGIRGGTPGWTRRSSRGITSTKSEEPEARTISNLPLAAPRMWEGDVAWRSRNAELNSWEVVAAGMSEGRRESMVACTGGRRSPAWDSVLLKWRIWL